jgi:predicted metalloprotease
MCDLPAIYFDLSLTSGINIPFIVAVTADNRLGNYIHASHTIVVNPRVCDYPEAIQRYVIAHEMGHSIAVDMGDTSEESADYYARLWYGNPDNLLAFVDQQIDAPLWAHIKRGWK